MSFKEVTEFLMILKELECPEMVEVDSFQYSDFPLVAKIFRWLVMRCDPTFQVPLEIEAEQDRVFFLKALVDHMILRYNLVLDPRKLYLADGYAVRELLKIARLLSDASNVWNGPVMSAKGDIFAIDEDVKAKVIAKVMDLQTFRKDHSQVALSSAEMSELLRQEPENHALRISALNMKLDPSKVESSLNESILEIEALAKDYDQKFSNIEFDKANLEAKIKKREEELERMQRRLHTIQKTKPTHLDESDKLENELKDLYGRYSTTFRTFLALEHQVQQAEATMEHREQRFLENNQEIPTGKERKTDSAVIDDGFNEDPVDGSEPEVPFNRARVRQSIVRTEAVDEASVYSHGDVDGSDDEEEPIRGGVSAGNQLAAEPESSDDDF
ncbi:putative Clusterin-associated protein 1-like protein [Hypsibius exemplaris]|uniref:Clusterin-associated protein 1-like protein n=1 Tax=Hypsibius exemplaris TaxID=2072580 RepID=A0A1W0WTQ5_HYPEX|nr:putative Clusterin-associated protein 1-like protein [Hypsibius exemplaris]